MEIKEKIKKLAEEYFQEAVDIRRHIHKNPELSFKEYQTSEFIQKKLDELGVEYKSGIIKTGIIAKIEGKNPSKRTIGLRADMDALPIIEKNDTPYKSVNKGVMHACGHDVHSASLLTVAKILNELKDEFEGTVVLIFQPGEERLPGGAKLMIEDGALDEYNFDAVIAQHVLPTIETGKVGFKSGMYMASCDELYMTVKGKGGHAAMPQQLNDAIHTSNEILIALREEVKPADSIPSILTFGKIIAEGSTNVVPDDVYIEGTFRTMNEEWRAEAHKILTDTSNAIAAKHNCKCELEIRKGYPFLINDERITDLAANAAKDYLGKDNVIDMDIRMTSEDFSYFSQKYSASMYRLGVMSKDKVSPLHTATFNIDEAALKTGVGVMSWIAVSYLTS